MCGVLPHNIYDYLFLPALLSSTPTSLGMRLELWRMEDHPGTGVWSVVYGCSNVNISTQYVTPKMNLAYNCDQWFLCGMITVATIVPLCTTGTWSVVYGCSNVAVSTQAVTQIRMCLQGWPVDTQTFCTIYCTRNAWFLCGMISIATSVKHWRLPQWIFWFGGSHRNVMLFTSCQRWEGGPSKCRSWIVSVFCSNCIPSLQCVPVAQLSFMYICTSQE